MTEEKRDNSLRLAENADWPDEHLVELPTNIMTGQNFSDSVDLIKEAVGPKIPQGSLFAYLFRRFGFPNSGSDDFKELCRYLLTTTHPRMVMSISPYCGGDSSISISFLVPHDVRSACDGFYQRSRNAREERFHAWIEEQERVPEWTEQAIEQIKMQGWPMPAQIAGWKQMIPALSMMAYTYREGSMKDAERPKEVAWYIGVIEDYAAIEPDPGVDYRTADWRSWSDDDPMKPYAQAVHDTLQDLKRPVWIRDSAINPWGQCEEPYEDEDEEDGAGEGKSPDAAEYAKSAGYPSGALGNHDPEGFGELHGAIMEAGKGDPTKGIAIALEALREKQGTCGA